MIDWFSSFFSWLWDDVRKPAYFRISYIALLILILPTVFIYFSITLAIFFWFVQCAFVFYFFRREAKVIEISLLIGFISFVAFYFHYLAIAVTLLYWITVAACFGIQEWFFRGGYSASEKDDFEFETATPLRKFSYIFMWLWALGSSIIAFDYDTLNKLYNSHFISLGLKDLPMIIKNQLQNNRYLQDMAMNNYKNSKGLAVGFLTSSIKDYLIYVFLQSAFFKAISLAIKKLF